MRNDILKQLSKETGCETDPVHTRATAIKYIEDGGKAQFERQARKISVGNSGPASGASSTPVPPTSNTTGRMTSSARNQASDVQVTRRDLMAKFLSGAIGQSEYTELRKTLKPN